MQLKDILSPITRFSLLLILLLSACQASAPGSTQAFNVLAVESFLAEIAQNVAGERAQVQALIPAGMDPHTFEPTPQDVVRIAQAKVLIVNGAGLEAWLDKTLKTAGGHAAVIEASAGLQSRQKREGEAVMQEAHHDEGDPHFWLDPLLAVRYVENIRAGLSQADPAGQDIYTRNAQAYIAKLNELHAWIESQVAAIPKERRLLVTNHESFGYFADRYSFTITGTLLPSVTTGSSPSAQQLARLIDQIKATGAPAIFLETGANPQLAEQVAREAKVKLVTDLYTHSVTPPGGDAPTYIDMMKQNVMKIVGALK